MAGQFVIVTFSAGAVMARVGAHSAAAQRDAQSNKRMLRRVWRRKRVLGKLTHFRSQAAGAFADHRATPPGENLPHLRAGAPLDRADYGSVVHAIGVRHGDESLLGAQTIDHALLPRAEHGVRKNGKVTEHPKKIRALKKRWHQITRPDRGLHLHHTV